MSNKNNHINYIELKTNSIDSSKSFYSKVFKWKFKDFGGDYSSFSGSGIRGGFQRIDGAVTNGTLVVLYHKNLNKVEKRVLDAGGVISCEIFSFPGGRRFHFIDPAGNELAVWSDR